MAASTSNLVTVQSATHFQELLSADLSRVSLINFWAPWAGPCAQMNQVVEELAKKHSSILALNVEAEDQSDIAESFDIEAVPSFIVLRGHTLLARIAGADAPALTTAIASHVKPPAPLSQTDAAPSAPPTYASKEDLDTRLRALMTQSPVVLFMKGSPEVPRCGFSRKISALLKEQNVEFTTFDILEDEDVRQGEWIVLYASDLSIGLPFLATECRSSYLIYYCRSTSFHPSPTSVSMPLIFCLIPSL
ncbi:putative glutaredoxin [Mycena rebaudengoi]|nr:putative glutaredoxin [Mycena rebaudengoi]